MAYSDKVVDHFEINMHPLLIQMTYDFGKMVGNYLFPSSSAANTDALAKNTKHIDTTSEPKERKSQYGFQESNQMKQMQVRANQNKSFIAYVQILYNHIIFYSFLIMAFIFFFLDGYNFKELKFNFEGQSTYSLTLSSTFFLAFFTSFYLLKEKNSRINPAKKIFYLLFSLFFLFFGLSSGGRGEAIFFFFNFFFHVCKFFKFFFYNTCSIFFTRIPINYY
jgi:hypothetical protein